MMTAPCTRRTRLAATIAAAGASLLLLAGCSAASGVGDMPAGAPVQPAEGPLPAEDRGAPQAPTLPADRKLARTATVLLEVGDLEQAAARLRQLALSVGGMVTSEAVSLTAEDGQRADGSSRLVLTVPAHRLDETLAAVAGLGELRSRTVESVDVTDAIVDVDSRVKTMRESIARLQELMNRAGSVSDIAQVEAELTGRQAELEALLAQQASLAERVATSPVTVTLLPADGSAGTGSRGFLAGLESGWQAMAGSAVVVLTVLGALLPWLVLAAAVGVPVWLWQRRRTRADGTSQPSDVPVRRTDSPPPAT